MELKAIKRTLKLAGYSIVLLGGLHGCVRGNYDSVENGDRIRIRTELRVTNKDFTLVDGVAIALGLGAIGLSKSKRLAGKQSC